MANRIGEGALSILFDQLIDTLGFDAIGSDGGAFTLQFFGATGALLETVTRNIADEGYFGFRADAGERIAAVTITNTDPAGIGYDNVTFNYAAAVPEPGIASLLALGVAGLVTMRRHRKN